MELQTAVGLSIWPKTMVSGWFTNRYSKSCSDTNALASNWQEEVLCKPPSFPP